MRRMEKERKMDEGEKKGWDTETQRGELEGMQRNRKRKMNGTQDYGGQKYNADAKTGGVDSFGSKRRKGRKVDCGETVKDR